MVGPLEGDLAYDADPSPEGKDSVGVYREPKKEVEFLSYNDSFERILRRLPLKPNEGRSGIFSPYKETIIPGVLM